MIYIHDYMAFHEVQRFNTNLCRVFLAPLLFSLSKSKDFFRPFPFFLVNELSQDVLSNVLLGLRAERLRTLFEEGLHWEVRVAELAVDTYERT